MSQRKKVKITLSMSGCGFLGVYHVGVMSCFREFQEYIEIERIAGASGGAIAAAAFSADCCIGEIMARVLELAGAASASRVGPLNPRFSLPQSLQKALRGILPDDAHVKCNGRLGISLTRCHDRSNLLVSRFDSKEDLIQALVCTSFIPMYSGLLPPFFRDGRYWDGGLSNNLPIFDGSTVTVSPFSGECDICPADNSIMSLMEINASGQSYRINSPNIYRVSRALFPPHPEILKEFCEEGYKDALRYIKRMLYEQAGPTRYMIVEKSVTFDLPEHHEVEHHPVAPMKPKPIRSNSIIQLLNKYTPNTVNLPNNVLDAVRNAAALRAQVATGDPSQKLPLPLELMYYTCSRVMDIISRPSAIAINFYSSIFSSIARCIFGQLLKSRGVSSWIGCNCEVQLLSDSGTRCIIHGKAAISPTHSLMFALTIEEDATLSHDHPITI